MGKVVAEVLSLIRSSLSVLIPRLSKFHSFKEAFLPPPPILFPALNISTNGPVSQIHRPTSRTKGAPYLPILHVEHSVQDTGEMPTGLLCQPACPGPLLGPSPPARAQGSMVGWAACRQTMVLGSGSCGCRSCWGITGV